MSVLFIPTPLGWTLSALSLLALWHSFWLSLSTDPHRHEVGPILSTVGLADVVLFPMLAALLWPAAIVLTVWAHAARMLRDGGTAPKAVEKDRPVTGVAPSSPWWR